MLSRPSPSWPRANIALAPSPWRPASTICTPSSPRNASQGSTTSGYGELASLLAWSTADVYATHAISPLLALMNTRATRVQCFGSGRLRDELRQVYGNPYPAETAIFQLAGTDVAAEVTRTLFHTARAYTERFSVYGERATFEWQQRDISVRRPQLVSCTDASNGQHTSLTSAYEPTSRAMGRYGYAVSR